MGWIARLLSFTRVASNHSDVPQNDVKVNPTGGNNMTAEGFCDPGDDAFPLKTDYVAIMGIERAGRGIAVGYSDVINQPRAQEGDKRIYGRKASDGTWINEVWLKADGTVISNNQNGTFTLSPNGDMTHSNSGSDIIQLASGFMSFTNPNGGIQIQSSGIVNINGASIDLSGDFKTPGDNISVRNHRHTQGNDGNGDAEVDVSAPY